MVPSSRRRFLLRLARTGLAAAAAAGLPRARAATPAVAHLATLRWPPYVDPDLPGQGWVAEALRAALALHGWDLDLRFLPWERALDLARTGEADGVVPVYDAPERRTLFRLSRPLPAAAVRLYARADESADLAHDSLEQLAARPLGVVRGYANPPAIDDGRLPWRRDEASTDLLNLRKLVEGRVDLVVIDELVAQHLAAETPELVGRIAAVGPSLGSWPTFVALHRGTPPADLRGEALRAAIDAGLDALWASGGLRDIVARHGLLDALPAAAPPQEGPPAESPPAESPPTGAPPAAVSP